ncbi:MAG TPA: SRPBCC domain-containing protein [Acidimicrobiia bacterium]|nr:SRPBCC domain-containing protein [Acidimicrobiia bacterium]
MADSITVQQDIAASPDLVYRHFTNGTLLREWLADVATLRAEEGGRLHLAWNDGYGMVGNFMVLVPGKKVAFTWIGSSPDPVTTEVTVSLEAAGAGTTIGVEHTMPPGADDDLRAAMTKDWERSLENLASVMETGEDLRFTRRPMLGVMVDAEVNPERAKKHNIPVDHGVILGGTVEGMGAAAAGLAGGDAVVQIGETPINGFSSFSVALEPLRAGDTVDVVYYRDGEEHTTAMTLSGRPIPEIPATAAALSAHVRELYDWVDAELAEIFEGVDDMTASKKPEPGEWSAKEVLAHLLDGEGDYHSYIAELVQGAERMNDGPFDNSDLRTRITAESYGSPEEMLAAYRHLEGQTVAIIAALPDDFVARKGSWWRLAYGYTQARPHYEEHFAQIRAALEAAG